MRAKLVFVQTDARVLGDSENVVEDRLVSRCAQ